MHTNAEKLYNIMHTYHVGRLLTPDGKQVHHPPGQVVVEQEAERDREDDHEDDDDCEWIRRRVKMRESERAVPRTEIRPLRSIRARAPS